MAGGQPKSFYKISNRFGYYAFHAAQIFDGELNLNRIPALSSSKLPDPIEVDAIIERTLNAGVTVEGILLKDGFIALVAIPELDWEHIDAIFPKTISDLLSDHNKAAHDALDIDADTLDGSHLSDINKEKTVFTSNPLAEITSAFGTKYIGLNFYVPQITNTNAYSVLPVGILKKLIIYVVSNDLDGSMLIKIHKNGSDSSILTKTITGGSTGVFSVTGDEAVSEGDLVCIKVIETASEGSACIGITVVFEAT